MCHQYDNVRIFWRVELLDVGITLYFPPSPISRYTFAIESACRRCGKSRWILLCLTIKISSTQRNDVLSFSARRKMYRQFRQNGKRNYPIKSAILNIMRSNFFENYEAKITERGKWIVIADTRIRAHTTASYPTHTWTPTHMMLREHQ